MLVLVSLHSGMIGLIQKGKFITDKSNNSTVNADLEAAYSAKPFFDGYARPSGRVVEVIILNQSYDNFSLAFDSMIRYWLLGGSDGLELSLGSGTNSLLSLGAKQFALFPISFGLFYSFLFLMKQNSTRCNGRLMVRHPRVSMLFFFCWIVGAPFLSNTNI